MWNSGDQKKLLWKPYKSDYIQSFLNVLIKHLQEKEKEKEIWL